MKILFSGYHNPYYPTITEYLENAIVSLGHELVAFDDRRHLFPGRLRDRFIILNRMSLNNINRKLVALSVREKPDVVIITGGHRIFPNTVELLKDKGIITVLWTIDPPMLFEPVIRVAPFYDYIFCQGTEAIMLLEKEGVEGAEWLPMACDPLYHHAVEMTDLERKRYGSDVVFVGSYYPGRAEILETLTGLDIAIWGPGWDALKINSPLQNHIKGVHTKPMQWCKIYSASKISLALHYQSPENTFPVYQASPRVFEILACGCFQIVDSQKDVLSLFNSGEHLEVFEHIDDLKEKIGYYLSNPDKRAGIARAGCLEAREKHTYVHRIQDLLTRLA